MNSDYSSHVNVISSGIGELDFVGLGEGKSIKTTSKEKTTQNIVKKIFRKLRGSSEKVRLKIDIRNKGFQEETGFRSETYVKASELAKALGVSKKEILKHDKAHDLEQFINMTIQERTSKVHSQVGKNIAQFNVTSEALTEANLDSHDYEMIQEYYKEHGAELEARGEPVHIRRDSNNKLPRSLVFIPGQGLYALLKTKGEGMYEIGEGSFKRATKALNLMTGETKIFASADKEGVPDSEIAAMKKYGASKLFSTGVPVEYKAGTAGHRGAPGRPKVGIIMDYMKGGDLYKYRLRNDLTNPQKAKICLNFMKGLQLMHKNGDIHMDIKPENIFIGSGPEDVRVADLGSTIHQSKKAKPLDPQYNIAPEVYDLRTEDFVTTKADIWSVGVVLVDLFAGSERSERIEGKIHKPEQMKLFLLSLLEKNELPTEIYSIVSCCLTMVPEARPDAGTIISDLEKAMRAWS